MTSAWLALRSHYGPQFLASRLRPPLTRWQRRWEWPLFAHSRRPGRLWMIAVLLHDVPLGASINARSGRTFCRSRGMLEGQVSCPILPSAPRRLAMMGWIAESLAGNHFSDSVKYDKRNIARSATLVSSRAAISERKMRGNT